MTGATITATGAEAAVVEGSNSIVLNDTALSTSLGGEAAAGHREGALGALGVARHALVDHHAPLAGDPFAPRPVVAMEPPLIDTEAADVARTPALRP